jgi:adenosylmethionine-8-amino-7-oxononanoate aminotransferase
MGARVVRHMREQGGVITRFSGDHVCLAPPLVIRREEVDLLADAVAGAVRGVTGD